MAKGKGSRGQRDAIEPSLAELLSEPSGPLPEVVVPSGLESLEEIESGRQWHPEGSWRPSRSLSTVEVPVGRPGEFRRAVDRTRELMEFPERIQSVARSKVRRVSHSLYFDRPGQVVECVRRRIRREVMFSLPVRARRKGAGARRRRNDKSQIHC